MKVWPICQCQTALTEELGKVYVDLAIAWDCSVREKSHSKQLKHFAKCSKLYKRFQEIQATEHKSECAHNKRDFSLGCKLKLPNLTRHTKKRSFCRSQQSMVVSPSQRKTIFDVEKARISK